MKHILIVEDEPDIQELLRAYLEVPVIRLSWPGMGWRPWSGSARSPLTWCCWT